jgi:hypothetical protein
MNEYILNLETEDKDYRHAMDMKLRQGPIRPPGRIFQILK